MRILQNLRMDLARCGCKPLVGAVQGEANTRTLVISLYDDGVAWEAPAGATAAVAFAKPDGRKGLYDTLPDGTPATSIAGSVVTITLAPQVLTTAGEVLASVVFNDAELDQLATFPFRIRVEPNPAAGEQLSNDYYNYTTMAEINAVIDEALAAFQRESASAAPPIICEESGSMIAVDDASTRIVQGLTLYGKTTQDGTPTPESPVELVSAGAGGSIKVNVAGRNLYSGGDLFSISVYRNITLEKPLLPGTYTLSAVVVSNDTDGSSSLVGFIGGNANGNNVNVLLKRNNRASVKVTLTAAVSTIRFCAGPDTSNSSGDTAEYTDIQIERGSVATQFEPYKPIQTFTASTPDSLPGIPVTSGGNYTDENGQQWACDEIDFASGVKVTRIGVIESYDGEEISGAFMSTAGGLTAGAKILYILPEPIETPLSAEGLAQYAALHTNKPNTTMMNDAGAGMKLAYVADTKLYIDKKLAEISAAMLNA